MEQCARAWREDVYARLPGHAVLSSSTCVLTHTVLGRAHACMHARAHSRHQETCAQPGPGFRLGRTSSCAPLQSHWCMRACMHTCMHECMHASRIAQRVLLCPSPLTMSVSFSVATTSPVSSSSHTSG